jgi:hypothetical protein
MPEAFLTDHPISQPSLDISPARTPIITSGLKKKHKTYKSVQYKLENLFFLCWYHTENFVSPVMISVLIVL